MSRLSKLAPPTAVAVTLASLVLSPSASAEPVAQPDAAPVSSCYGGARSWGLSIGSLPRSMPSRYWVTSSRCRDINLKITSYGGGGGAVRVCFYPYRSPMYCNQYSLFMRGEDYTWRVIARNVRDGTRFKVEFWGGSGYYSGYVAY